MMNNVLKDYYKRLIETVSSFKVEQAEAVADAFLDCHKKDGTVYIFGNGGSGSTASHICGDFLKGVSYGLEKRFKMICFNDNNSSFSAISNDIGYDDVFVEPLKNFLKPNDLVIGISGSGNSTNVVKALEYAKKTGAKTVAMCGYKGGKIKEIADIHFHAEVMDMEITEDAHLITFHAIKQAVISKLKGSTSGSMGSIYDSRVK